MFPEHGPTLRAAKLFLGNGNGGLAEAIGEAALDTDAVGVAAKLPRESSQVLQLFRLVSLHAHILQG